VDVKHTIYLVQIICIVYRYANVITIFCSYMSDIACLHNIFKHYWTIDLVYFKMVYIFSI